MSEHTITDRPPPGDAAASDLFRLALDSSGDCLAVLDSQDRIDFLNASGRAAMAMDAASAVEGRPWIEFWKGPDEDRARQALAEARAGRRGHFRAFAPIAGGGPRWWDVRLTPIDGTDGRLLSTARDVTAEHDVEESMRGMNAALERRAGRRAAELADSRVALRAEISGRETAEAQLRHLQKMEAVGQLTGGIAHDFNNMLAVIIAALNLAERRLARGEDARKYFTAAAESAARGARLTERLLVFSRQLPLSPEALDANRMVSTMSEMLRRTLGESIRVESVLAGGLWKAHADIGQLESAILNLAINARDAMPEGGRLTIETANSHLDEAYARDNLDVRPGQYVMIALSDTGTGMPPEVAARAFDPFFTTKEVGKGTGLGLSQVYGFIKQSGGHIKIYSEPGQGTSIKMYLPRLYGSVSETAEETRGPTPRGALSDVVLFVEDELRMREMGAAALRELGYTVLHASSAGSALQILANHPEVSLLFTDIVMPGMNGRALVEEALKRRPGLKVLFTTGYTRNALVHGGVLEPGVNFLAKPYTLDQLGKTLQDVLANTD